VDSASVPGNSLPFEITMLVEDKGMVTFVPSLSIISVELAPVSSVKNLSFSLLGSNS